MGETAKSYNRRVKENFFSQFAPEDQSGIDIGCQHDPLNATFRKGDYIFGDPDATWMEGVEDNSFHTVYASHVLEHLNFPYVALQNWYRITAPGGHLIVIVPHRDLYEKKFTLPSRWNPEHKTFWLPDKEDLPVTHSLRGTVVEAIPEANIVSLRVLQDGWQDLPVNVHSVGEYSIEVIIKK